MPGRPRIQVTTRLERFFRRYNIAPSLAAEACGINRNRLIRYRDGTSSPRTVTVRRLVKGLNERGYPCKANDLFELDDDDRNVRERRLGPGTTRFDRFLVARGIKTRPLAERSGYPAEYTRQVRNGLWTPDVDFVRANVRAVRELTGDRAVTANLLFPLDDDDSMDNPHPRGLR